MVSEPTGYIDMDGLDSKTLDGAGGRSLGLGIDSIRWGRSCLSVSRWSHLNMIGGRQTMTARDGETAHLNNDTTEKGFGIDTK